MLQIGLQYGGLGVADLSLENISAWMPGIQRYKKKKGRCDVTSFQLSDYWEINMEEPTRQNHTYRTYLYCKGKVWIKRETHLGVLCIFLVLIGIMHYSRCHSISLTEELITTTFRGSKHLPSWPRREEVRY